MEGPEALRGTCNIRDEQIAKIFERYVAALKDGNALDFDDLLLKTVELFETSEQARECYARKFRYVMVDEYQDTNRPQYLLIRRLAEMPPQPGGRRRSRSVDLQVARRRPAQHPRLRARLPRSDDRPARAELSLDAGHPRRRHAPSSARTATARTSGSGPTARAARGSSTIRGNDELEEADFIVRTIKQARAEDVDSTVAVLYRTNAQSRAIEDSLMREGIPYKIIGGVRFYERKEIKDALAYLKLIINPHDDVSLRRVINVPARGIGKGVMDGLQAIDPDAVHADAPPLLAAGLQEVSSARSLWARLVYAVEDGKLPTARVASLRVFRDLIASLAAGGAAASRCRSCSARCSIRPAT